MATTQNLSTLKIHKLTQEQYDTAVANGTIDENALYLTPDEVIDLTPYATTEQLETKADLDHSHDDTYYTETEIDTFLSNVDAAIEDIIDGTTPVAKATSATNADNATTADTATKAIQDESSNNIVSTYETKSDATAKLTEAKSYADGIKDDLLNGAGTAYDTLKELGDLIDDNTDAIDALEIVAAGKQDLITGAAATITEDNLDVNLALISDSSGKVVVSTVTTTELGYLNGVTSSIQTQLDGKVDSSELDNYYTKTDIDGMEFITADDIDGIWGINNS